MKPIYLDYNATTPVDPLVLEAMLPYLKGDFGNPSSDHYYGNNGKKAVYKAREQISNLLNCEPDEIVFTSGGSESNNYAIKGSLPLSKDIRRHIITSTIEHPAVLNVFSYLESNGFSASYASVDEFGLISPLEIERLIGDQTVLISIMLANNEVGTVQPIQEISKIAKAHGILMHTDAAQAVGKIDVNFKDLGVDLLSVAGHKMYAPKGIGALIVKRGVKLESLLHGAAHESGRRAGTENVPYIAALGKASELAAQNLKDNALRMQKTRDALYAALKEKISIDLNGHEEKRLPNTLSISFNGIDANALLSELSEVAASPGAACHAESKEISHVIKAMGFDDTRALSTVRFSTGRETSLEDINTAALAIVKVAESLGGEKNKVSASVSKNMMVDAAKNTSIIKLYPVDPQSLEEVRTNSILSVSSKISQSSQIEVNNIKLTQFTHGLGCACKIKPQILEEVLKKIPSSMDKDVLVDAKNMDDAAVYKIDDSTAIVQTVDFFTPIVDSPFDFGRIAAANSLSDIYAMGARPIFALNVVGFPPKRLPLGVLEEILKGAQQKVSEAGISILGGHTVEDNEPKFGLAVTGIVSPERIITNSNAKVGDVLILTKPIGTGIISTAMKRGLADSDVTARTVEIMSELNKKAAEIMINSNVNACTDITGFGLIGHTLEMARASNVSIELNFGEVPVIEGTEKFLNMGIVPGGTKSNLEYCNEYVKWDSSLSDNSKLLLCDAQTSGGLLISIPEKDGAGFLKKLEDVGVAAIVIGKVTGRRKDCHIKVTDKE